MAMLNAYYGGLLNSHQSEIMRLYYDCDLSLGEIAQQMNITRQGVREVIVRSENKLAEYENKLGLVDKVTKLIADLQSVINEVKDDTIKAELEKILIKIKEL